MNSHRSLCDQFAAEFVIERYAAGRLSETETQAFEEHLLVCDRCQEELTLAVAVREALPEGEADEESVAVQRLPWKGLGAGLTLAAAAVVATVFLLPGGRVSGPIAELGRVTQPPVYLGVPVRQAPARPDSVFDAAMSAYALGDYSNAAAGLDEAMAAGACWYWYRGLNQLHDPIVGEDHLGNGGSVPVVAFERVAPLHGEDRTGVHGVHAARVGELEARAIEGGGHR